MATVVVVDDTGADLRLVEMLLSYAGHRVVTASDAPQALELVRLERPDLLISDILLPSMDGYALVRELRRDRELARTRVLFQSAHYLDRETRRLAMICGVEHFISKPWQPEVMLAKIADALAAGPVAVDAPSPDFDPAYVEHLRVLSAKLYEKVSELERVDAQRQELQARRHELLERLIVAQEEERQRIATEMHDDTIQVMSAVGARLHRLRARTTDGDQLQLLADVSETVRLAEGRLRSLMFDLRPPALDLKDGLAGAIREYVEKSPDTVPFRLELRSRVSADTPAEVRLVLYRIAQEALINVRKHACATRVEVSVAEREDGIVVSVRDDGCGFEVEERSSAPGHLGLTAMRERADIAGGWWRCDSAPGAGTLVEFWVPL